MARTRSTGPQGREGHHVVFWKFASSAAETRDENEESTPKGGSRLLFTRGYSVFNAAQVDGYTPKADPDRPIIERIEQADAFFRAIGADVRHAGNQAFYEPAMDYVQIPPMQAFKDSCSGLMYPGVPTMCPTRVSTPVTVAACERSWFPSEPKIAFAKPKSSTFTRPSGVTLTLAGFRSR
jgi:hypothetical protein